MQRLFVLLCVLTLGCTFSRAQVPTPFPTATTVRSEPGTLVATAQRVASLVDTPTPAPPTATPAPTQTGVPAATETAIPTATRTGCTLPDDPNTQHQVIAEVDYEAKTVNVQQTVIYTNQTTTPLSQLVLNVEPNRWLGAFTLKTASAGEDRLPAAFTLTGRRMEVTLPDSLQPDCQYILHLNFVLQVPPIIGGVEAFRGYFGHTSRQINLGHWLPTVVPIRDGDWLHHETIFVGEQIVLDTADWLVTVNLVNAPTNTLAAAPGSVTELDLTSWRFYHPNGREFAVSISHVFQRTEAQSAGGVAVAVFALPDAIIWQEDTQQWLNGGEYAAKITA